MTQAEKIKKLLLETGEVSRNWCLQNYISRLGAIIYDLKKEGMNIDGKWYKTEFGRDYKYYLKKDEPKQERLLELPKIRR